MFLNIGKIHLLLKIFIIEFILFELITTYYFFRVIYSFF
jgi:hypothetical protein